MKLDQKAQTFSQDFGEVWRIHLFEEGNTRTVMTFAHKFAQEKNMSLDMELLAKHADYVRTGLVASAEDQPKLLAKMMKDAIERESQLKREKLLILKLQLGQERDL